MYNTVKQHKNLGKGMVFTGRLCYNVSTYMKNYQKGQADCQKERSVGRRGIENGSITQRCEALYYGAAQGGVSDSESIRPGRD